jgi:hypothetical protein
MWVLQIFSMYNIYFCITFFLQQAGTGISCKKKFKMYLSLSFHNYKIVFKSESLLLFKLNQLMVPIGKKPAPGDH